MRIIILISVLACLVCFGVGIETGKLWNAANSAQRIKELEDTVLMSGAPNTVFQTPRPKVSDLQ